MNDLHFRIKNAKAVIADTTRCEKMADIFKTLGDAGRLKIVKVLSQGELCASDIALALNIQNSVVSHQLKLLKHSGIISARKEGKFIFYKLGSVCVTQLFELVDKHLVSCR